MSQIFVSYSRQDADFAQRLLASISPLYDVWLDHREILPGARWEQSIEEGIRRCKVFLVIVTHHSNVSDWVARETILAERLGSYRIPVILEGQLPLRLLNLQYVDFRGEYEGGMRDLLEILKDHLLPHAHSNERARQLIGEGILDYIGGGDYTKAENLIAQALTLSTDLDNWSPDQFWNALRSSASTHFASLFRDQMRVLERTVKVDQSRYPDRGTYNWSLELSAPDDVLAKVAYVNYGLHPTFTPRNQVVRDRFSQFRLVRAGWGTFLVGIDVHFQDGSVARGSYELIFANYNKSPLGLASVNSDP